VSAALATGLSLVSILLLDDDPTMRSAARNTLRAAGCRTIVQTGDGHDALEAIGSQHIDLVLCDCQMAPMDGMTFLRRLRAHPAGVSLPVVMLTANNSPEDAWLARELKVAAWLVKPVPPNLLASQVAAALGMTAPHIQDDVLQSLAARYEAQLPAEISYLETMSDLLQRDMAAFAPACDNLLQRLHNVKGQAGTLGYPLLGSLASEVHDLLRLVVRDLDAAAALQPEIVKLVTVAVATMRLVADRKLRGDGGAVGIKLRDQIGGFAARVRASLEAAQQDARHRRDGIVARRQEAASDRIMANRRYIEP
jgi:CheY-like chemotaxis protein